MALLTDLGLRRPPPPHCTASGRFEIAGVVQINPAQERRNAATIVIADGRVVDLRDAEPRLPASEFAGCFALPGLIDMHVHLPPDNALKLTAGAALLYLAHGVTSLREAGDLDGTAVDAARRLGREGRHPVPRIVSCGPFVGAGKATLRNTILLADDGEAAADAAARRVKATGASFMKFYDGLTLPMICALARACARHGLKIMGHVPAALSYEQARIDEVQHFFGVPEPATLERNTLLNRSCDWHAVDERRMDRIVEATLTFGIANTPTIVTNSSMLNYRDYAAACRAPAMEFVPPFYRDVVWHPERGGLNTRLSPDYIERQVTPAIAKKQRLAKKLFDAGARLFLGTDVAQPFLVPGASLLQEMALFAGAGIPLEQVWKLATRDAGERLGIKGLGRLEIGAPADVLLYRRDPTVALENLASLEAVISAGRLYRAEDLRRAARSQQAYFSSPLIRRLAQHGARRALRRAIGPRETSSPPAA
jgi:imidazolonepropionase-like amidohydrolase